MSKRVNVFIAGRDLNGVFQKIRLPFAGGGFLGKISCLEDESAL